MLGTRIPGWRTKIPQASLCSQRGKKKKKDQSTNLSGEDTGTLGVLKRKSCVGARSGTGGSGGRVCYGRFAEEEKEGEEGSSLKGRWAWWVWRGSLLPEESTTCFSSNCLAGISKIADYVNIPNKGSAKVACIFDVPCLVMLFHAGKCSFRKYQ